MTHSSTPRYSLFTAITMVVGVAIGSGIFFKADNVLKATGGSVFYGALLFILGAIAIIFGGLAVGELASRTDKPGGVVTYSEEFVSMPYGSAFGWFHSLVYYPALNCVVAFVIGIYLCTLFHWEITNLRCTLIGIGFLSLCFFYNTISPRLGGLVQNAATIIKILPLVIFGVCGMIWGDPIRGFQNLPAQTAHAGLWIMGISAVAFSYDGWIVSTSIAHEIKDSRKNLPRALIIAPLIILCLYLAYFISISTFLGTDKVMTLGDNAIYRMAKDFMGPAFAKAVLICIIISVIGTVNGLTLGSIRLPYGLALRGSSVPKAKWFAKENKGLQMPVNSALFMYILTVLWSLLHYVTTEYAILGGSDVSEISICFSYILYIAFYWKVFQLWQKGEIKSFFRGVICPLMATLGSGIIIFGSLIGGPIYLLYLALSALVFLAGMMYYKKHAKVI
ncbi:MAG: APC family permease [Firmicutes bacterium]|nr:APC family permease [Bacillota bacterium]